MLFEGGLMVSSFAGSALVTGLLATHRLGVPLDRPNPRSLHSIAVPRGGGLGIWAGWALAWPWLRIDAVWLVPAGTLALISFIDDHGGLAVGWRLLAQIAACGGFVFFATRGTSFFGAALDVIALVWVLNLFNFMDGADGLAGGIAVVAFSLLAIAAESVGAKELALILAALSAACLGFLLFNFQPARIFLGDVGSIPLGFLAGAFSLQGVHFGYWPVSFALLVLFPVIADASTTLAKRLLRGHRIWEAHRDHYYQRLVQMGWTHRATAVAYYALTLSTGFSGFVALRWRPDDLWLVVIFWCIACGVLSMAVDRNWAIHQAKVGANGA